MESYPLFYKDRRLIKNGIWQLKVLVEHYTQISAEALISVFFRNSKSLLLAIRDESQENPKDRIDKYEQMSTFFTIRLAL